MSSLPARRCLDLAAASAPALLGRVVDQTVSELQELEPKLSGSARQQAADAWLQLLQLRSAWCEQYPARLRTAFAAQPAAAAPAAAPAPRRQTLELVDEESVSQAIESSRLTQLLMSKLEQPLAELDALMSSALGLPTVQPERNPLRPANFAQALRVVMQPGATPESLNLWTRHLAAPLAKEIANLYREALKLLQDADLQAASYRVLPVAGPQTAHPKPAQEDDTVAQPRGPAAVAGAGHPGGGGHAGPGPHGQQAAVPPGAALGGAAWADLSRHGLGDELFQHFLFARTPPSTQALAPAYYAQVEQQLASLERELPVAYDPAIAQQHRGLAPVERPHRAVDTATVLDSAVWGRWGQARERALVRTRLKQEAREVGQVLGLEVVRKLVDQVGRDPRLLAPVREAIVALEPALLKLALQAPRFFSQEEHSGRRLVERVAERSFRFNDEFASEFHSFFTEVRTIFQALNEAPIEDDSPFGRALSHLEERWTEQDGREVEGRQVAVNALHFAEAREAEAAQIAFALSERTDLEDVPAVVQDFLFGPWSLVLAHARLTDPDRRIDPGGWGALVPDLLWSVKPKQTLRDPARLVSLVPVILKGVMGGLALLGEGREQHLTFFNALEKLHRPVLKLTAKQRQSASQLGDLEVDAALLSTERKEPPRVRSGQPFMARKELAAAGFDEPPVSAPAPLEVDSRAAPLSVSPAEAGLGDEAEVTTVIDALQLGCWVDLFSREAWRRAHLTWVSTRATLFMFVSHGGRPHSMTRRSLERLVRDHLLRPVEAGAVVERAMEELRHQRPQQAMAA